MNKAIVSNKYALRYGQQGFGMLSVLIGTVVLLGVTVAVVASTRGGVVGTDVQAAQASGVIAQANVLLTAYETGVSRGAFTAATLNFDATGLYSPSITGVSEVPLLAAALDTDFKQSRWQFGRAVALKGYGLDTGAENAFYLVGVTQAMCGAVNRALTGSSELGTVADTATTVPPNAATVTTVQGLFNLATAPANLAALQTELMTSKRQPAAPAVPGILAIQDNQATPADVKGRSTIGCFKVANVTTPVHVVYAIAQAN